LINRALLQALERLGGRDIEVSAPKLNPTETASTINIEEADFHGGFAPHRTLRHVTFGALFVSLLLHSL
jgi:hypothetical protein